MSRLPFDPSRVHGPEETSGSKKQSRYRHAGEAAHLTVSELTHLIKRTLEDRISSPLRVVGEISNLSVRNHWYFSLKDENAVVSCVAWASSAKKFGFTPKDGEEVLATGHVSHYPPQGRTQLYVTRLEPRGAGALEAKFRAMCDELRRLGYFDDARKKPLPAFPRRIAVITAADGAAVQDVIATAAQRCKAVAMLIVDVRVQGEGAASQIARAIRQVDREKDRLKVEAILVTRGGGSIEDLWAFNERIVADAALKCSLPLIAAIGHESDTTVIELVADVRAATPTQAAMRLVPASDALERQVAHQAHRLDALILKQFENGRRRISDLSLRRCIREPLVIAHAARDRLRQMQHRLDGGVRLRIMHEHARVERLAQHLHQLTPLGEIARRFERLAHITNRLDHAMRARLDQGELIQSQRRRLHRATMNLVSHHADRLDARERQLSAIDPRLVLQRGYSFTTGRAGRLVRSVRDVRTGDALKTHVADGSIDSTVDDARPRPGPRMKQSGTRSPSEGLDQMDLFPGRE